MYKLINVPDNIQMNRNQIEQDVCVSLTSCTD